MHVPYVVGFFSLVSCSDIRQNIFQESGTPKSMAEPTKPVLRELAISKSRSAITKGTVYIQKYIYVQSVVMINMQTEL